jgi:2-desacetyl-2-hydroxyethyl bacteriochlorophyllide A dehydrogenase
MKAIVYTQYGTPDVLRLQEVEKPSPKDDDVLVKIHAASVNKSDWLRLTGKPFITRLFTGGPLQPQLNILGSDIAGTVEAVGRNIRSFRPGDEVFADVSGVGLGGFAEYVAVPEKVLARKPASISFEEAAAVPVAGVTALQGLRDKGHLQPGQKVLIHGASGGVGTFAVQVAKAFGAEVTAVCSTRNVEMARSMGADEVIDYKKEDFAKRGEHYDLIFAANGNRTLADFRRALTPDGLCVIAGGTMRQIFRGMLFGSLVTMGSRQKITNIAAQSDAQDLAYLAELLEAGKVRPVIDRCYPLSDTADALRYLGDTHPSGKVVIQIH